MVSTLSVCKILITTLAALVVLFNLIAELNTTHVWNVLFEPHARFHIVWQLASSVLYHTFVVVYFVWLPITAQSEEAVIRNLVAACGILSLEPLGFLFASATIRGYGGSFFPVNVPEYNINVFFNTTPVAVAVFGAVVVMYVVIGFTVALTLSRSTNTKSE
eukprot:PhF_6_TR33095/c0_g1_i1/m.48722